LCVPGNSDLSSGYRRISSIIGWVYFFAWTLSFYPQVILNATRKTTVGMVSDKLLYDFIGFSCLSVYCISMYYVDSVRQDYKDHYNDHEPKVTLNDVCFAVHALLFTFVQIGQMSYYNGLTQLPSKESLLTASIVIFLIILYLLLCLYIDSNVFIFLYWLNFISYVKICVTMVKYIPQVLLNYSRKSTVGWSITACTLDLIGSTMSMLQLFLDCYDTDDWSGLVGDIVKFLLGLLSLGFDVIFIVQHYILYPHSRYETLHQDDEDKTGGLIDKGDREANGEIEEEKSPLHSLYHPPSLPRELQETGAYETSHTHEYNRSTAASAPPPSAAAPSSSCAGYILGQKVEYTSSSGLDSYRGEIIGIHHDAPDGLPYYTIRYDPGRGSGSDSGSEMRELQTDGHRLRLCSDTELKTSLPMRTVATNDSLSTVAAGRSRVEHPSTAPIDGDSNRAVLSEETGGPIYYTNEALWE
jgi:cystinosin